MAYPNLEAEMARHNITAKDIAQEIGKSSDTVNNWLKGKGDFPIGIAFTVQKKFFSNCSIGYLFSNKPITVDA